MEMNQKKKTKLKTNSIDLDDFKFYENRMQAKHLLKKLQDETDEDKAEDIKNELRKEGFFDWSDKDFYLFTEALN